MPIDPSQLRLFQQWLDRKGITPHCPCCGRGAFTPGEIVTAPADRENGPRVPMFQVACDHCAYIMLFAAAHIGLETL